MRERGREGGGGRGREGEGGGEKRERDLGRHMITCMQNYKKMNEKTEN